MTLTNTTDAEIVFASRRVLAANGELDIGDDYSSDISLREAVNRMYDGVAFTVSGEPEGFPIWGDDLSEPGAAPITPRGGARWAFA